ncbi:MAG TPA: sugar ABC transporter substrate-binding protein [Gammaproteobacteria bacterium]|nr:sugar ABC transporter substrate-binding protein [Gammaproteobacteria bacterium]
MNKIKYFKTLFVLVSLLVLASCAVNEPHLPPKSKNWQTPGPSVLVKSYQMAVGDQIQINVWRNSELSLSEPIRPDGKISMPLVGDVMAVGLTPEELSAKIESRLASYVKAPNVTVILTDLQGHEFLSRIRVTGSVVHNVSMSYHQGMTVLDAVLEAGSVDLYADANNTKLHRRTKKGVVSYDIRLKDILEEGDMLTNVTLMPGDIITVPESNF